MSSILQKPPPPFDRLTRYGTSPQQFAELRFPQGTGPFPLLLVVHGGFWQAKYDLKHTGHLCADLTSRGIVTCNLEYRRLGDSGGGWPGTFLDIGLATDHLSKVALTDDRIDSTRVAVLGHSAGGHLALWLVSRHRVPKESPLHQNEKCRVTKAVSLAGVCDLRAAFEQRLGGGIVSRFMGGGPEDQGERYSAGSPIELLPTGAQTVLIHGSDDDVVPVSQSELFAKRARNRGENSSILKLDRVGHFELINPATGPWVTVVRAVLRLLES